jgi:hypothetical protein
VFSYEPLEKRGSIYGIENYSRKTMLTQG